MLVWPWVAYHSQGYERDLNGEAGVVCACVMRVNADFLVPHLNVRCHWCLQIFWFYIYLQIGVAGDTFLTDCKTWHGHSKEYITLFNPVWKWLFWFISLDFKKRIILRIMFFLPQYFRVVFRYISIYFLEYRNNMKKVLWWLRYKCRKS